MILETVIVNLTRNLDLMCQGDGKSISSHEKLKEEAIKCLHSMIENAPDTEYENLIQSDNHEILLGYLLNILCQLAKNDKSRSIKLQALHIVDALIDRLEALHNNAKSYGDKCSIITLILALPGISSALFKLIMSDTKLPTVLLVKSIQVLGKFITVSFLDCDHSKILHDELNFHLTDKSLNDTCDNLAARIVFLMEYVTTNSSSLHDDVKYEMLNFCTSLVTKTKPQLLARCLKSIVGYLAFVKSFDRGKEDISLKMMLLTDNIRHKMQNCEDGKDQLDSTALSCMFQLLDDLSETCLSMLICERQAKLATLCGLMKLLPQEVMTTFLEISTRKDQLFNTLFQLVEFSSQQPFLFLTEGHIRDDALVSRNIKLYTIEKRFLHLSEEEISSVDACCQIIGQNSEWSFLSDIIKNDLLQFSSANNLYITSQVLKGCLIRDNVGCKSSRFASQMLESYIDNIRTDCTKINLQSDEQIYTCDILKTVIEIETTVTLIQIHLKFVNDPEKKIVLLKNFLCPLLNWCATSSRAISEASLNALTEIGQLYGHQSTESFIRENIDYLVDGATRMLDNYLLNPEVTDVLSITFKLSSMDTFYYFKDVFEKVFGVLAKYHHTNKSESIVLFFFRTLTILNEWLVARGDIESDQLDVPLSSQASIEFVISNLSIDKRVEKLGQQIEESRRLNKQMEAAGFSSKEDEEKIAEQIKSGKIKVEESTEELDSENSKESNETKRSEEIVLTEKILLHCVGLMSSNCMETKTLALKTAACGFKILQNDENTLLPLVHKTWPPLLSRLTQNSERNLEVTLCAFECLLSMALYSKDFIRRRALESIVPRLSVFIESQWQYSLNKREYDPYCMTVAYKCQLKLLTHLGQLAYHTDIAYSSLWRIVKAIMMYMDKDQVASLRDAAKISLNYLIALDADCVWYYAKQSGHLDKLPFSLIYERVF